ncbi:MAG: hypothetical protein I4O51_07910 [Flavobacterium micromati]|nr:hypothetical protein [Flavobacterium micromati]
MEIGFFSSTIVQVAISVIISWALFALLCSMIHEVIVRLKSERGRFYRTKINEKLFDGSNQINWGILIYNHSSIKLFTKSEKAPPVGIDPKTMAEVLVDIVANCQAAKILKFNHRNQAALFQQKLLNDFDFATTNLGQSDVIVMLRKTFDKAKIKGIENQSFNEEKIYSILIDELTIWFEQFNNRTSAWYKKLSQKRLFAVGFLVALAANVDSVALFEYYKGNPTARIAMIEFYAKNKVQLEAFSVKYNTVTEVTQTDSLALIETKVNIAGLAKQMDSLKNDLELPIGWDQAFRETMKVKPNIIQQNAVISKTDGAQKVPKNSGGLIFFGIPLAAILFKILGFIISAFAASIGAPFWFDLLKKATTVTSTIIKKV